MDVPEPVREFRGTQPKYWANYLEQYMAKLKSQKESNPSVSASGESSPADPNSVKPDPKDDKPQAPKTRRQILQEEAATHGYRPVRQAPFDSHGQPVFRNRRGRYITPDADGHQGGKWKLFDRRGRRIATLDHCNDWQKR